MTSFDRLPIIDVTGLFSADRAARAAVAEDLGRAAREVGFFYIRGHGIAPERIAGLRAAAATLFAHDLDWKMACHIGLACIHYVHDDRCDTCQQWCSRQHLICLHRTSCSCALATSDDAHSAS